MGRFDGTNQIGACDCVGSTRNEHASLNDARSVQKPLPSEKIKFWSITCVTSWLNDEVHSWDWLKFLVR